MFQLDFVNMEDIKESTSQIRNLNPQIQRSENYLNNTLNFNSSTKQNET